MVKIEAGTVDNTFTLNGLPYKIGLYEIYYHNRILDDDGDVIKVDVEIGLRNRHTRVILKEPKPVRLWSDTGDTPYSDFDTLVTDIVNLITNGTLTA